jgi:hypothetical protein
MNTFAALLNPTTLEEASKLIEWERACARFEWLVAEYQASLANMTLSSPVPPAPSQPLSDGLAFLIRP